tara:strand:+ start:559 stop:972 length:414 start_codon:yes stop_codon:yes gene_type:complete
MKVDITKSKTYSVLILLLFGMFFCSAQTLSTNETKIVFILSKKTNSVSGITLLDIDNSKNVLPNTYPNHIFYLGILIGSYELSDNLVIPLTESTITIYTDKALFSEEQFSHLDHINFGSVKTKVISKKKGEIILKTL